MTEQLKRRLIGVAVMVLVALALAAILPEPRLQPGPDEDIRVVTIPLQEEVIVAQAQVEAQGSEVEDGAAQVPPEASVDGEDAPPEIEGDRSQPLATAGPQVVVPTPSPRPAATSAPRASPSPTPAMTARPTQRPAATAMPTPTPTPVVATATTAPTPIPAASQNGTGNRWWVQIGSFADIGNAREAETRLAALGQPTVMAPIEAGGSTLYRVRSGPYATEARAQDAFVLIVRSGMSEARLIKP